MITPKAHAASFRDRSGFVFTVGDTVYRQISPAYRQDYEHLQESGLYQELVANHLLVSHQEVASTDDQAYKTIQPAHIPFISYPYEWSFSQLKVAALLTLKIQKTALRYGMVLKDASAYNVQFRGCNPIFIDTLSFERLQEGEPWVAYRQFCQHFLAPLAVMGYTGVAANKLMATHLDGLPLATATALLPWRAKLNLGLLLHLFMHQKAEQKPTGSHGPNSKSKKLSSDSLFHLADNLETTVSKLSWEVRKTTWGDYYANTNYPAAALQHKEQLVKGYLAQTTGERILDVGANNSHFSSIAAEYAPLVIAIDTDVAAVEQGFLQLRDTPQGGIMPLLVDIANPSPAIGWNNTERSTFFERAKPDTILALAIIHHLVLSNNVPLPMLAVFLAANCRYLVVEFVPPSDSQVQEMLQDRKGLPHPYSQAAFETAFAAEFILLEQQPIVQSERVMYFMQSKNAVV